MKIINALGGGGSSFVLRALERINYHRIFGRLDPYPLKLKLEKKPSFIPLYHLGLKIVGAYAEKCILLKRPDSFWTDWDYHPSGRYEPSSPTFSTDLLHHQEYIVKTRFARSAGLPIAQSNLDSSSLSALVYSYLEHIKKIERKRTGEIILLSGHWGEYGVLAELNVETVYLIRDPFNSLISHSKGMRHKHDYLRRGLTDINSRAWIDAYLNGPHHYWCNHARVALTHQNAIIIRYHKFGEDWQKTGLPDISGDFEARGNTIEDVLTKESVHYIYEQTYDICEALGFDFIYRNLRYND
ncbi:hypothetical protein KFU94_61270 [Chloroflexi bacterium TSY]|nr:hypothetical protein [Chloroflexi bacterium TSY]